VISALAKLMTEAIRPPGVSQYSAEFAVTYTLTRGLDIGVSGRRRVG